MKNKRSYSYKANVSCVQNVEYSLFSTLGPLLIHIKGWCVLLRGLFRQGLQLCYGQITNNFQVIVITSETEPLQVWDCLDQTAQPIEPSFKSLLVSTHANTFPTLGCGKFKITDFRKPTLGWLFICILEIQVGIRSFA